MKRSFFASVAVCSLMGVCGSSLGGEPAGELLYDIDFSEPFHTFGGFASLDTGGAPRQGFSDYFLTDPANEVQVDGAFSLRTMKNGVGVFANSAQALLELENGDGNPGTDFDIYTLEFETVVFNGSSLTVFFDAPSINRFTIGTDSPNDGAGLIRYDVFEDQIDLADYTFGELLAVRVTYHTVEQRWRIEVDGEVLYQGPFQNNAVEPNWVRFSSTAGVFLDNIQLSGSFVECGDADLNDDGILDLSDINAFITAFTSGCTG